MKRLTTLFAAILCTTGMVIAQSNTAITTQDGSTNSSTTIQIGSDNNATVLQGFGAQGQNGASAAIEQDGVNNEATIKQRAWSNRGNEHTIDQVGTSNKANVDAFNGDNFGEIMQNGAENYALMQHGAAREGQGSINQNGDNNFARLRQYSGTGNTANIIQGVNAYTSNDNDADLKQTGNDNNASFSLTWGDGNNVTIDQIGDNNYSEYSVKYGDMNTITADVEGNNNRTRLNVNTAWGNLSSGNSITVTKDGDFNWISGKVEGSDNTITLIQDGFGNSIGTSWHTGDGVNISGDNNTLSITQSSDNNSAFTTVIGSNNSATITQN